jgi:hypothetical protein
MGFRALSAPCQSGRFQRWRAERANPDAPNEAESTAPNEAESTAPNEAESTAPNESEAGHSPGVGVTFVGKLS